MNNLEAAIEAEWTANDFYKRLMEDTPNPLFKEFIEHAAEDEEKHYHSFQKLYYQLTGHYYEHPMKRRDYESFEDGVVEALKDELEASDLYRDMILRIPVQYAYEPLFIAMTDEMEHATRFSTIYGRLR
nr:ferritin-like domain-containing protein [Pontibacillus sp. HN14]